LPHDRGDGGLLRGSGRRQEARRRGEDAKCTKDAQASCDTQAADKKLAGAARTSFTKKCVSDASGM